MRRVCLPDETLEEIRRWKEIELSGYCKDECQKKCCTFMYVNGLTAEEAKLVCGGVEYDLLHRLEREGKLEIEKNGLFSKTYAVTPPCPSYDSESGLCKIYDSRPRTCREFPLQILPGEAMEDIVIMLDKMCELVKKDGENLKERFKNLMFVKDVLIL